VLLVSPILHPSSGIETLSSFYSQFFFKKKEFILQSQNINRKSMNSKAKTWGFEGIE